MEPLQFVIDSMTIIHLKNKVEHLLLQTLKSWACMSLTELQNQIKSLKASSRHIFETFD